MAPPKKTSTDNDAAPDGGQEQDPAVAPAASRQEPGETRVGTTLPPADEPSAGAASTEGQQDTEAPTSAPAPSSTTRFATRHGRQFVIPGDGDRDEITITEHGTDVPDDLADFVRDTATREAVTLDEPDTDAS